MPLCNQCCFGMFIISILGYVNLWIYFNNESQDNSIVVLIIGILFVIPILSYPIYYYIIHYVPLSNDDYVNI
jgi:hypothetical protein